MGHAGALLGACSLLVFAGDTYTLSLSYTQRGQLLLGISGDTGATQGALRVSWLRVQAL